MYTGMENAQAVPGMTDKQIRDLVRPLGNGECAVKICRDCGAYWVDPNGNVDSAKIVEKCKDCRKMQRLF